MYRSVLSCLLKEAREGEAQISSGRAFHTGEHQVQNYCQTVDKFVNRGAELWNDTEIIATFTAPGTIRTAVGKKIWNKIPGKTCVKILINK